MMRNLLRDLVRNLVRNLVTNLVRNLVRNLLPDEEPDEEPGEESDEESSEESDEESVDQLHRDLKDVRKLLKDPQCHVIVYRKRNYYQKKVQIVVAVRGTNLLSHADLKEDLKISFQHLHKNERLVKIDKLVRELIKRYGCESICLTGHSLGAAIAFIVARQLYLDDKEVEGHFFALPFMPLDRIIRKIGSILHYEMSVCGRIPTLLGLDKHLEKFMEELTEWSASFVSSRFDLAEDAKKEFNMLMSWHPHIYVQKFDVISNGYIEFFRDTSSSSGLSRSTAFLRRLGMGPSAILITSKAELGTITSHGIDHWIDVEPLHFEALQIITNLRQVRDFKEL
ncbi:hypothetical protein KC19_4G135600 [Ceratodon purpureus]|uniref:Fungal lipase-type domain-containing protein n=1 Tax=Ceratodon purpureus TaxID=3225 RepID=A0A8T0IAE4_CERPU|nr:hypothetical protein KC19_4G135600 [Ceratodon purpureus]